MISGDVLAVSAYVGCGLFMVAAASYDGAFDKSDDVLSPAVFFFLISPLLLPMWVGEKLRHRKASAIETGTAETEGLGPKDESAVPQGDAQ